MVSDADGQLRGFVRLISGTFVAYTAGGKYRGRFQRRDSAIRVLTRRTEPKIRALGKKGHVR